MDSYYGAMSDSLGAYLIPVIPVGRYDVKAMAIGHCSAIRPEVVIPNGGIETVDFVLKSRNARQIGVNPNVFEVGSPPCDSDPMSVWRGRAQPNTDPTTGEEVAFIRHRNGWLKLVWPFSWKGLELTAEYASRVQGDSIMVEVVARGLCMFPDSLEMCGLFSFRSRQESAVSPISRRVECRPRTLHRGEAFTDTLRMVVDTTAFAEHLELPRVVCWFILGDEGISWDDAVFVHVGDWEMRRR
jgi:hypothetical protein